MKKKGRSVQNYEIVEVLQEYEQQYTILLGRNVNDHKLYALKKLSLKGKREPLYDALLNEAKLLKLVRHENIVACYRMFKTTSHLYIVYGYQQTSSLAEVLEAGPKVLTFVQKESIAKQLCLGLTELQKNRVVHLNIRPESITLDKNLHLTLREFMFASEVPQDGDIDLRRKIPKSEFVAPEVRKGIADLQADIFSFGKILEKLQLSNCKRDPSSGDNSKKIEQFEAMVAGMINKDRYQRWTLTDVYQCLFSRLKKVKRLRSLSENITTSRSTAASMAKHPGQRNFSQLSLKVLQQRSMSAMLVRLFEGVAVRVRFSCDLTVVLSLLLLKKSTKVLANLGKYLRYGKNDIGLEIPYQEYVKFSKSADCFKLVEVIEREITTQKKQLDCLVQAVMAGSSHLMKHQLFQREMKEETVNQGYFTECLSQYLQLLAASPNFLKEQKELALADILLLTHILLAPNYQSFHRQNLPLPPLVLEQQPLLVKISKMPKVVLIQNIKDNLTSFCSQPQSQRQQALTQRQSEKQEPFLQPKSEEEAPQCLEI